MKWVNDNGMYRLINDPAFSLGLAIESDGLWWGVLWDPRARGWGPRTSNHATAEEAMAAVEALRALEGLV